MAWAQCKAHASIFKAYLINQNFKKEDYNYNQIYKNVLDMEIFQKLIL